MAHVLDQLESPRFIVVDTMDLWINTAIDELRDVISRVDMLMLNDDEARLLTGVYHLRDCAARLLEMGPRYIVIKKGEHGAMLVSAEGLFLVPAYPVDAVVDPTGAGDAFAGAFMGSMARRGESTLPGGVLGEPALPGEATVRNALLDGAVTASFGVEGFSLDRLGSVSLDDLVKRRAELERMLMVSW